MNPLVYINWVDILGLLVLVRTAAIGLKRGVGSELLGLMAAVSAAVISLHSYKGIAEWVRRGVQVPVSLAELSVLIILVATVLGIWRLAEKGLGAIARLEVASQINAFGGVLLGAIRGAILLSLFFIGLELTSIHYFQVSIQQRSLIGAGLRDVAPAIYHAVIPRWSESRQEVS